MAWLISRRHNSEFKSVFKSLTALLGLWWTKDWIFYYYCVFFFSRINGRFNILLARATSYTLTCVWACVSVYLTSNTVIIEITIYKFATIYFSQENIEIHRQLSPDGVKWQFIFPWSPYTSSLCESAVKSIKNLIYKLLVESHLTYEESCTPGCLSPRSLTEISQDPSNLTYLTPAHFLIGQFLLAVPDRDESNIPANRLDRWRIIRHFFSNTLEH